MSTTPKEQPYVSPYREIFDRIEQGRSLELFGGDGDDMQVFADAQETYLECGLPESALKFATTSYGRIMLEPHVHPTEHKVVVKVNVPRLPLSTATELHVLREILGARFSEERNEIRLACNLFGSRIENKRHVVTQLDQIILSCQRIAAELEQEGEESKGHAA
jgi:hypothetical protein